MLWTLSQRDKTVAARSHLHCYECHTSRCESGQGIASPQYDLLFHSSFRPAS